ncbi:MAG: LptE family protein [Tepidisphaeraceae bacterium]|jgi:hypothetical protein
MSYQSFEPEAVICGMALAPALSRRERELMPRSTAATGWKLVPQKMGIPSTSAEADATVASGRPARTLALLPLLCATLLLAGCGYSQTGSSKNEISSGYHWNSLFREDVQSVAVPIFTNKDYRRGVEFRLTEAVIKQIEARAPYKVVPKDRADTVLEGQITQVWTNALTRDYETNLPREQVLNITVDLIWKDLRNGQILMQRKNFSRQVVFYPTLGEGDFIGTQDAVEKFAVEIVQEMQADW